MEILLPHLRLETGVWRGTEMRIRSNSNYSLYVDYSEVSCLYPPLPHNALCTSKERAKWKRTEKKRLGRDLWGSLQLLQRGGFPSRQSRDPCSPSVFSLSSFQACFWGLFSSRAKSWQCILYLGKDNYIHIPGRDRPAVSREESDVEAQGPKCRMCVNTEGSRIALGGRNFSDQNFSWSSFLHWLKGQLKK